MKHSYRYHLVLQFSLTFSFIYFNMNLNYPNIQNIYIFLHIIIKTRKHTHAKIYVEQGQNS